MSDMVSHVSTGGGAFLSYMRPAEMPALSALEKRVETIKGGTHGKYSN